MIKSRNTLLMSAAAVALIAGVGLAFAQAPDTRQSAPAEKSSPAQAPAGAATRKAPDAAVEPGQPNGKTMDRKGARGPSAQDNGKTGATPKDGTMSTDVNTGANRGVSSGANAEPNTQERSRTGTRQGTRQDTRQERSRGGDNAETRTNRDTRGSERTMDRTRDGQSGFRESGSRESGSRDQRRSDRSDNLSDDRRSTIRTIITRQNVRPMTNVDFALSIGTRVPRHAHFHSMPRELVAIHPGWRGFTYVLVGDQILVVNPRTQKIVAILDA
jgi:hypothetical protein